MPFTSTYGLTNISLAPISAAAGVQRGSTIVATGAATAAVFYYDVSTNEVAARTISTTGTLGARVTASTTSVFIDNNGAGVTDPVSATRLANGNLVVVWTSNEPTKTVYARIFDANLVPVGNAIPVATGGIHPDVVGLTTGQFIIAYENPFSAGDNDILARRYSSAGVFLSSHSVDTSSATLDERPSIAALTDGGYAIGWDRINPAADIDVYAAVFNNNGSTRAASFLVDTTGVINRDVDIIARSDGGFTLVYEDSAVGGTINTGIAVASYNSAGITQSYDIVGTPNNDRGAAAALSPDGFAIVAYNYQFSANDTDVYARIIGLNGVPAAGINRIVAGTGAAELLGGITWLDRSNVAIVYDIATGFLGSDTDAAVQVVFARVDRVTNGDAANDTIDFRSDGLVDTVFGGDGNDVLLGGDGDDFLFGQNNNDVVVGGAGNDQLEGNAGSNELYGGTGDDVYFVTVATDSIVELANEGTDSLRTLLNSYTLPANVENLTFTGTGNFVGVGNAGDNVIAGKAGNDSLGGGDGNDTLVSNGGSDELVGGTGNDIYFVLDRISSTIEFANQGIDEVRTAVSIYVLQNNVENLTFTDNAAHAAGVGNDLDNVITGGTGQEALAGAGGNDVIVGGAGAANELIGGTGNDRFVIAAAGDTIIEYVGEGIDQVETTLNNFTLRANLENLVFTGTGAFGGVGSDDNNRIQGGDFDDSLIGGNGDDVLVGRAGADLLIGGAGADVFYYDGLYATFDRIIDFTPGSDKIAVVASLFPVTGTLSFEANGGGTATTANSTFTYNQNNGIVSYDADGSGAGAARALAQLNTGLTLSLADFQRVATAAPVQPDFAVLFENTAQPAATMDMSGFQSMRGPDGHGLLENLMIA